MNQKALTLRNYLVKNIMLGKYCPGGVIPSENALSVAFALPKSVVHGVLKNLAKHHLLKSLPQKAWTVEAFYNYQCLLNIELHDPNFSLHISQSQTWSLNQITLDDDLVTFQAMIDQDHPLDFSQFFHFKKTYYDQDDHANCHVKYALLGSIVPNLTPEALLTSILQLLAQHQQVITKTICEIKITNDRKNQASHKTFVKLYYVVYNQNDEVILLIKHYSHLRSINSSFQLTHTL